MVIDKLDKLLEAKRELAWNLNISGGPNLGYREHISVGLTYKSSPTFSWGGWEKNIFVLPPEGKGVESNYVEICPEHSL